MYVFAGVGRKRYLLMPGGAAGAWSGLAGTGWALGLRERTRGQTSVFLPKPRGVPKQMNLVLIVCHRKGIVSGGTRRLTVIE